jgi:chromosome partitioning protein
MLTHEDAIAFLKKNPALAISTLEKEANLPSGVLSKAVRGERTLNKDHLRNLSPILTKYGYKESSKESIAKVICVANHKGGVGKTTTTLNLGRALTLLGKKVLVVDLDSQGNLSQGLGVDEPKEQVVHALLQEKPLPTLNIAENFDLSPSDLELAEADLELVQTIGGFNRLNKAIRPLRSKYDFVLIDCPPSLNIITSSAMVASDSCLITLQPEIAAVKGLDKLLSRIERIREEINEGLQVEGILFTMVNKRLVVHQSNIEYVKSSLPAFRFFNTMIRENVSLTESQSAQKDVFEYSKDSIGAQDYMELAKELLGIGF